ncbi:hypothetical protein [Chengkuizengella sediminis]|nr:hypothetical protein [Chengkuizengella sediminis]NDI37195.1 hypothetical protein [Chengkuizengella sediminis]
MSGHSGSATGAAIVLVLFILLVIILVAASGGSRYNEGVNFENLWMRAF